MGKAVAYILTRWEGLGLFAGDGRVEMDSNLVENQTRPLVLNRKNALFVGHDEGAQNWARIASLIATCKMNGVEPFACLKATLEAIAAGHPNAELDDLLPWAFPKAAVQSRSLNCNRPGNLDRGHGAEPSLTDEGSAPGALVPPAARDYQSTTRRLSP
jgi:hypothetical protein